MALKAESRFRHVSGILVVSDNDDDPGKSLSEVQDQLRDAGYGVPQGTLTPATGAETPPVVIMMLPWAGEPGNLETLCLRAMYDASPELSKCVDEFCKCAGVH